MYYIPLKKLPKGCSGCNFFCCREAGKINCVANSLFFSNETLACIKVNSEYRPEACPIKVFLPSENKFSEDENLNSKLLFIVENALKKNKSPDEILKSATAEVNKSFAEEILYSVGEPDVLEIYIKKRKAVENVRKFLYN